MNGRRLLMLAALTLAAAPAWAQSPTLADLAAGKLEVIDLAYPLNAQSAFWPAENYRPFQLDTIATLEKNGVLSKAFASPEHLGTHLDAPNHFVSGKPSVDQLPPERLFGPGVVIDVSGKASADPDFRLTAEHVKLWERQNGPVPEGAIVLLHTGWGRFWNHAERFQGRDASGRLHFPGYAADAAEFLVRERKVRGLGIDTMSVDYGLSRDFDVHKVLGRAERFGLENVANLEKLPARGFYVFVAPIKIETGSGGPTRIFAVQERPNGN